MKKNICSFCGQDMGWNQTEVMRHETQCLFFQNSLGVRTNLPNEKPDETNNISQDRGPTIYPDGLPGFFEED